MIVPVNSLILPSNHIMEEHAFRLKVIAMSSIGWYFAFLFDPFVDTCLSPVTSVNTAAVSGIAGCVTEETTDGKFEEVREQQTGSLATATNGCTDCTWGHRNSSRGSCKETQVP